MTLLLNADVGEGFDDALVMPHLDAANIACGAHAGDEATMRATVQLAKTHRVQIGAHPGYPDRANFGRQTLAIAPDALDASIAAQIAALAAIVRDAGLTIDYVKPHGALNHDMLQDDALFARLCAIVAAADCGKVLMVPTNAREAVQENIAREHGLAIWWEVFADRAYEADGLLRARRHPDAVHGDAGSIRAQWQRIAEKGEIVAIDGSILDVRHARTVCIHGDHPPSIAAIRPQS
ncbi:MAG: 5-oxoprolinase subunit PxpA [Cardiobacteriaceae bacterium]|nr:5-oxoprolinase subunit PxpA [Cardiobacteriaceae bacterium]